MTMDLAALERLKRQCIMLKVTTLVPSFLIESSSLLQVMRTALNSWMGLKLCKIGFATLERLKNSQRLIMGEMFNSPSIPGHVQRSR